MQKPYVEYDADEVIENFISEAAGTGTQEFMIGCEVLFAAGLVARDLALVGRKLTMKFQATPVLKQRLDLLTGQHVTRVSRQVAPQPDRAR